MATRHDNDGDHDHDELLAKLIFMGFDCAQSQIALIKNDGDLERAMEFLLVDDAPADLVHPPDEENNVNVSVKEDEEGSPHELKIQAEVDSMSGCSEMKEVSKQMKHDDAAKKLNSAKRRHIDPPADLELISAGNGPVPCTTRIRHDTYSQW
ncbi:hypothetical protein ACHAXS_007946 [Conticribra weissflogii]